MTARSTVSSLAALVDYITLEGEDVTLEGRREIVTSLGGDLRTLLNELDSFV